MISGLPPNTDHAVHLRSPSSSGGKDWVGAVTTNNELHTFWGKTGSVNQHACKGGTVNDLQKIINQKTAKGYAQVDEYNGSSWSSQRASTPPPSPNKPSPPKKQVKPVVEWEKVPPPVGAIDWDF